MLFAMENILTRLGLSTLWPMFQIERIEPRTVAAMTDDELKRVGVRRVGDRDSLREMCDIAVNQASTSRVAMGQQLSCWYFLTVQSLLRL